MVKTSITTGSLAPLLLTALMTRLTSWPGLSPVTVNWGLVLETLAKWDMVRPSTTSSTNIWSSPPSKPGRQSTWRCSTV